MLDQLTSTRIPQRRRTLVSSSMTVAATRGVAITARTRRAPVATTDPTPSELAGTSSLGASDRPFATPHAAAIPPAASTPPAAGTPRARSSTVGRDVIATSAGIDPARGTSAVRDESTSPACVTPTASPRHASAGPVPHAFEHDVAGARVRAAAAAVVAAVATLTQEVAASRGAVSSSPRATSGTEEQTSPWGEALTLLDSACSTLGVQRTLVVGHVKEIGAWSNPGGRTTFEKWRATTTRQGLGSARAEESTATTLHQLPTLGEAASSGRVTEGHVTAVAQVMSGLDAETRQRLAQREADIVERATTASVPELRKELQAEAAALQADTVDASYQGVRARRFLRLTTRGEAVHLEGMLDVLAGEKVRTALEALTPVPAADDTRSGDQRRADALEALASRTLSVGLDRIGAQVRPQLTVLIREDTWLQLTMRRYQQQARHAAEFGDSGSCSGAPGDGIGNARARGVGSFGVIVVESRSSSAGGTSRPATTGRNRAAFEETGLATEPPLAQLLDGTLLPFAALDVLACDATWQRVVLDPDGTPLDVGRSERTFAKDLRRSIMVRDRHCQWPGCTIRAAWCEGHHVQWWSRNGGTSLDNGIALCSAHHTDVHTEDVRIVRLPQGFRFIARNGRRIGESTRVHDSLLVPRDPGAGPPADHRSDTGPPDNAPPDVGRIGNCPPDSGRPDSGRPDSGRPDSGLPDSGRPDSGPPDSGLPDSGRPDSGPPDSGPPDSGLPDAGLPDSGLPDSGLPDSGLPGERTAITVSPHAHSPAAARSRSGAADGRPAAAHAFVANLPGSEPPADLSADNPARLW